MAGFDELKAVEGKVLVTGGAGFIGAHTCVELLSRGYQVIILDNFSNSQREVIDRIKHVSGRSVELIEGDINDARTLESIFERHTITAVIHFAAYKAVAESMQRPLDYYKNNLSGLVALLSAMQKHAVWNIIFSSSCTVYGDPEAVPVDETSPLAPCNPYGRSKLMGEQILDDLKLSEPRWNIAKLRYFNPIGAHASGLLGEDPRGVPNNLMPYMAQVAIGRLPVLKIFGGDYPTADGTGVRDYIHVIDVARGHLLAMEYLWQTRQSFAVNLGLGRGFSVLEVVHASEAASGKAVPYEIVARRPGDVAEIFADPTQAAEVLGWRAEFGLDQMCTDFWRWQSNNPNGLGVTEPLAEKVS